MIISTHHQKAELLSVDDENSQTHLETDRVHPPLLLRIVCQVRHRKTFLRNVEMGEVSRNEV